MNTIVAMSHVVFDPVLTERVGRGAGAGHEVFDEQLHVAVDGDTLTRDVSPPPPVNALLKPEST